MDSATYAKLIDELTCIICHGIPRCAVLHTTCTENGCMAHMCEDCWDKQSSYSNNCVICRTPNTSGAGVVVVRSMMAQNILALVEIECDNVGCNER